ncbi:hypothetical protein NDN08_002215 [Rhodosorus marinus]|uniref:Prolyl endopeptidase n=1 Tax=Rhodosorus marinus TaxID=101924 RepID=A0AAV8UT26_9RHOD|nr:hypothetical protein NDN08_002215 [Rhodosorus marinus]
MDKPLVACCTTFVNASLTGFGTTLLLAGTCELGKLLRTDKKYRRCSLHRATSSYFFLSESEEAVYHDILRRRLSTGTWEHVRHGSYNYYHRNDRFRGACFCRRMYWNPIPLLGEQVLLDSREFEGSELYSLEVAPNHQRLAFLVKTGSNCSLVVKDLEGKGSEEVVRTCTSFAWENTSASLIYVSLEDDRVSVFRHSVGSEPNTDSRIFFTDDPETTVDVRLSKTCWNVYMYERKEGECFIWQIERSCTSPRLIYDQRLGAESTVEDLNDQLILLRDCSRMYTTHNAHPFKWDLFYELSPPRRIVRFDIFNKFVVLYVRDGVNALVQVINEDGGLCEVAIPDDCYSIRVLPNPTVSCNTLKLKYSTFTTPTQIWEVNMRSMRTRVLAAERILFTDLKRLHTRRLTASSNDGLAISISLVEPKDRPCPRPCVIMAYGAYGVTCEPEFSVPVLCLLEQGVSFAIVHVRGGGEVVGRWSKNQAVEDLVHGIQELVSLGIVDETLIFGWGSSAGGSLFAAAAKREPRLFAAMALLAPFLDVAGELMKPGTPSSEIQEWFDLKTDSGRREFALYNPMDVASVRDAFPDLLLIGYELDDKAPVEQIVDYYDRIRAAVPRARIELRVVPEAGHSGPSDPFQKTRVTAAIIRFFIHYVERRLLLVQKNLTRDG